MILIDADKENYINYFNQSLKLKSKKGIILIDNTLWKGDVANPKIKDKLTIKLREFNKYIKKSPINKYIFCLLYTSPSPRDVSLSRMPSSA